MFNTQMPPVVLPLLLALTLACGPGEASVDRKGQRQSEELSGLPKRFASSEIWSSDPEISRPWMLATHGDLVLLADARPPGLHVFRAADGERIRTVFSQGEGPGSFATAPSFVRAPLVGDTLWVIDPILRRATAIPTAALRTSSAGVGITTQQLGTDRPMSLARLPNGDYFGVTVSAQRALKLVRIAHDGGTPISVMSMPLVVDDSRFLPSALSHAYNSRVCASPDGRWVALVYNHAGRIDVVETGAGTVSQANVPYAFNPPVTIREGSGEALFSGNHPDGRRAYMDCHGGDDRLYALFQGKPWVAPADSAPPPPAELHEFDWTGRLLRVTVLDHSAFTFTLNPGGNELLTVAEGTEGWEIRSTLADWK